MNGINSLVNAPVILPSAGALPPVASSPSGDAPASPRKEVVSQAPNPALSRDALQDRAQLLQNRLRVDPATSSKNLQAIRAYRSLEDASEREQVSRLLGVDEYA